MSDYPFKAPSSNPFSASKKEPEASVDPNNRVEQALANQVENQAESEIDPEVVQVPVPSPAPVAVISTIAKPSDPLPQLTMEEKSCRSCEYYSFDESMIRCEAYKGECRRNAPMPGQLGAATWPEVEWKSWCGEWANGVSNEDMVRMARDIGESIAAEEF